MVTVRFFLLNFAVIRAGSSGAPPILTACSANVPITVESPIKTNDKEEATEIDRLLCEPMALISLGA